MAYHGRHRRRDAAHDTRRYVDWYLDQLPPNAFWRLDREGVNETGDTAIDQTGNHNGTWAASSGFPSEAGSLVRGVRPATFFNQDRLNDHRVDLTDSADFDIGDSDSMSVTFWVRVRSTAMTVFGKWDHGDGHFIDIDGQGRPSWFLEDSSQSSSGFLNGDTDLRDGDRHMVGMVLTSGASEKTVNVWVDGQSDGGQTLSSTNGISNAVDPEIGRRPDGFRNFRGVLQHIAIHKNTALTDSDMQRIYEAGAGFSEERV